MNQIEWLKSNISNEYQLVMQLKGGEHCSVNSYCHNTFHKNIVVREFVGDSDVFQVLKTIQRKNIEMIYDAVQEGDHTLVIEEFIDGKTLADILQNRLFSEKETVSIIRQLCDALYVIHSQGIIHRDIKPENIMLDKNGVLKLIDFSAARLFKPYQPKDTQVMGTIGFAAPEQFGEAQTDIRTDIYAAGILMNVMLTGEHPSKQIYVGKLYKIIDKCIQPVPQKRYTSALKLKKAL
jgi:serine/threonine protein kinase